MSGPKDIVAFMIGTRITNDVHVARSASSNGLPLLPLERRRFAFMAAAGFGAPWAGLAKAPALIAQEAGE